MEWFDWDGKVDSRGLPSNLEPATLVLVQLQDEIREDAENEYAEEARSFWWEHRGNAGDVIAYVIIE